mmetsp:Transcript_1397/g.3664  ORF Transcript_1397/g.3664 Transcript_1397/m.3664 type:complete len:467 (-) Transcript_1397:307-1707(-)
MASRRQVGSSRVLHHEMDQLAKVGLDRGASDELDRRIELVKREWRVRISCSNAAVLLCALGRVLHCRTRKPHTGHLGLEQLTRGGGRGGGAALRVPHGAAERGDGGARGGVQGGLPLRQRRRLGRRAARALGSRRRAHPDALRRLRQGRPRGRGGARHQGGARAGVQPGGGGAAGGGAALHAQVEALRARRHRRPRHRPERHDRRRARHGPDRLPVRDDHAGARLQRDRVRPVQEQGDRGGGHPVHGARRDLRPGRRALGPRAAAAADQGPDQRRGDRQVQAGRDAAQRVARRTRRLTGDRRRARERPDRRVRHGRVRARGRLLLRRPLVRADGRRPARGDDRLAQLPADGPPGVPHARGARADRRHDDEEPRRVPRGRRAHQRRQAAGLKMYYLAHELKKGTRDRLVSTCTSSDHGLYAGNHLLFPGCACFLSHVYLCCYMALRTRLRRTRGCASRPSLAEQSAV